MTLKNVLGASIAIVVCEAVGAIGTIFTAPAIGTWYTQLARPEFAPPNWIFGPVWTTLFALMGIALFIIWKVPVRKERRIALWLFSMQLALNVLWSALFFGLHSPVIALIEIGVLWISIFLTILAFARISRTAAWLLVPYILWVSFAAYLNYSFWILN
jgi:benzodiazapine receptor